MTAHSWGKTPLRAAEKLRGKRFHDPESGAVVQFALWDEEVDRWSPDDGYFLRPMFEKPPTTAAESQPTRTSELITSAPPRKLLVRLPSSGGALFGREDELAALNEAWRNHQIRVQTFIALGGTGKTAVVRRWLRDMANDDWRGAERVLAWSFHSQGSDERTISADAFVEEALQWFGDEGRYESRWKKGERLAELISLQRTVVVLDGIEALQYPSGDAAAGQLRDPALLALLNSLSMANEGLCVVTSRLSLSDLADFEPSPVAHVDLRQLDSGAAIALLESYDIQGPRDDFEAAATAFAGHALTLTLLGTYLRSARRGDIRAWREVQPLRDSETAADHARRVMAAYRRWFGDRPELAVLQLAGLFDRPVLASDVTVIRDRTHVAGLTDRLPQSSVQWHRAVRNLRDARLLFESDEAMPDLLDAHPLVREYFGETLRIELPAAWRTAHEQLYRHIAAAVAYQPDTLPELLKLYEAVAHGREAGRAEEALDNVYFERIQRREKFYAFRELGITTIALTCLSGFFEDRWTRLRPDISEDSAARVMNECGVYLRAAGRLRDAAEVAEAAFHLRNRQAVAATDDTERRDAQERAATNAANVSEICESLGELLRAQTWAQTSLDLADASGHFVWRQATRARLASVYHHRGDLALAAPLFEEAVAIAAQKEEHPYLFSLRGFQYDDYLLDLGKLDEVFRRTEVNLAYAVKRGVKLDQVLEHLTLARAHLLAEDLKPAAGEIEMAFSILNQTDYQHHRVRALILSAEIARERGDRLRALAEVKQATDLANRFELRLLGVDGGVLRAKILALLGRADEAASLIDDAFRRVELYEYRRRASDLRSVRELLVAVTDVQT